ncbi:MAG TPA: S8 family serine peptidase [Ktedonosporobacter sp.]|nr:S8 family serine peptidase [Ktedonosporobacter sp.]
MQNMPGPTSAPGPVVQPWWSKMTVYWLNDQIAITFYSDLPYTTAKQDIIASLHLDDFNYALTIWGYKLSSFQAHDVRHVMQPDEVKLLEDDKGDSNLNSLLGKHVFQHPSGHGSLVKCFFHVEQAGDYSMAGTPVIRGMGSVPGMSSMYGSAGMGSASSTVSGAVNLINASRAALKQSAKISIVAATPNWLVGGTHECSSHGCPLPPVPVLDASSTNHITLPELSSPLQRRTGDGVTVFVLDTSPSLEQIKSAAGRAGKHNPLLQTLVAQMDGSSPSYLVHDPELSLPAILDLENPQEPATGRDILGRLVGYDVTDHGLFVTGIIRDLVPDAKIEAVRVLNNFGVGSTSVIIEVLEQIHNRMSPIDPTTGKPGDLCNKPVVINLSLVTMLHQEEMVSWWSGGRAPGGVQLTDDTEPLCHSLHAVIQSLTALGAVIVAAAGNDSDNHQLIPPTDPQSVVVYRTPMKPRYPAAFPEVLSVGAVDSTGHASVYSNDPVSAGSAQRNGVATYGGGFPMPVFPDHPPCPPVPDGQVAPFNPNCMTGVDRSKIDALIGLYSSPTYPALSIDDSPDEYKAPNDNGWTYWSGTSFATPIISAVAARLLEEFSSSNLPSTLWQSEVMRAFTTARGQKERLTGDNPLPLQPEFSMDANINIGLLRATQGSIGNDNS